jgi:hypothetical protein
VLLIVVLVAVISLTVGLAAISRSINNTRTSTEESNSQKALSAAEAGLEAQIRKAAQDASVLDGDTLTNNNFDSRNSTTFKATIKKTPEREIVFNDGLVEVSKNEGGDVWLSKYPDFSFPSPAISPSLDVYWANAASNNCGTGPTANPAIEIIVIRGADKNDPTLDRYAVDHCNRGNNFINPGSGTYTVKGQTFNHRFHINPIADGRIVRIIPIYNDAKIAVVSSVNLPPQGFTVESEGTSGEAQRKVKVFQSFPTVPIEIFPYNLFNP